MTRRRRPVAAALLTLLAAGSTLAVLASTSTDAGFVSAESATLAASAGIVPDPAVLCTPHSRSPHVISLSPGVNGLTTSGYRVTTALTTEMPADWSWQTGENEGVPLVPLGDSTWPAARTTLKFGVDLPMLAGGTVSGTATVHAVGPGGWESAPVSYRWTVSAHWGIPTTTCDRA